MTLVDDAVAAANLLERIGHLIKTEEQVGELYPAQWAALRYLARANRYSRTPMALTHYLGTTRGTVSQTIIALERKGLVERTPSKRDKRSVDVELTAAGRKILKSDPVLNLANEIKAAVGTQPKIAREILEKILARLIAANNGRAFGQCKACRYFERSAGSTSTRPHACALLEVGLSDVDSNHICVEQTS